MNTRLIIGIILAIIIIGFGGYFLLTPHATAPTQVQNAIPTTVVQPTVASNLFNGSISDLISRGGNYKCTWATTVNGTQMEGTAYVSGTKYSSVSNVSANGMTIKANTVGDGTKMYVWSEIPNIPTIGSVFTYDQLNAMRPTGTAQKQEAQNLLEKYNYTCKVWSPDNAKFIIPTNVTFR